MFCALVSFGERMGGVDAHETEHKQSSEARSGVPLERQAGSPSKIRHVVDAPGAATASERSRSFGSTARCTAPVQDGRFMPVWLIRSAARSGP